MADNVFFLTQHHRVIPADQDTRAAAARGGGADSLLAALLLNLVSVENPLHIGGNLIKQSASCHAPSIPLLFWP